ncbi:DUF4214 domain-containing protein [Leisingera sp. JC11]|uniref:DUF4214 domain-containing protein n=1 Tax=Leisingera sp. JC11 TaxID=3042469 RepID=UPI003453D0A0
MSRQIEVAREAYERAQIEAIVNDINNAIERDSITSLGVYSVNEETGEISRISTGIDGVSVTGNPNPVGGAQGVGETGSGGAHSEGYGDGFGRGRGGVRNPILLALETENIEITELSQSQIFFDSNGDGLENRTAWAAAGNGVLFYDPEDWNEIQEDWQYIFTEWDPSAASDIEALASYFDTNDDGVFDASDLDENGVSYFSKFKVMVTLDDGSTEVRTLTEAGVTSIDVVADTTRIELPDGSVITGQTTFTRDDGSTGTVGDVTLAGDAMSYRVEVTQDSTDASGTRTLVQTAYNADGSIVFEMTSVVAADGSQTDNSYDDDGDGIVDRVQVITRSTEPDGSRVEDVRNYSGASVDEGVFENHTRTTRSADGDHTVIDRDSTGGGWFDQREERVIGAGGGQTITVSNLSKDGSVLQSNTNVIWADGQTRLDRADLDGDGDLDAVEYHDIVEHANGSRTETWLTGNGDYNPGNPLAPGTLASSVTVDVSADERHRETRTDLDGDGAVDRKTVSDITANADGSTVSLSESFDGNGGLISRQRQTQSDDTMNVVTETDRDGDGSYETKVVDDTTVNGSGTRIQTVSTYNGDGSLRHLEKTVLEEDKITSRTLVDGDRDGSFTGNEWVRNVYVDETTQDRITETWDRNADGSYSAYSHTTTSEDGLHTDVLTDLDGDGNADRKLSDDTDILADGKVERVIETRSADGTKLRQVKTETVSSGLLSRTWKDLDGDGSTDYKTVEELETLETGGTKHRVQRFAGDGDADLDGIDETNGTLLSSTVTIESSDRRTTTTKYDYDGGTQQGGSYDRIVIRSEDTSGAVTVEDQSFNNNGSLASETETTVSADGLVSSVSTDINGDGIIESLREEETTLFSDGRRSTEATVSNSDGSLRSQATEEISANGRETIVKTDADGDGVFERVVKTTTGFLATGQTVTTTQQTASDGTMLNQLQTEVDADGLKTVVRSDQDGDGSYDLTETSETAILADGSTTVTAEVHDVTGGSAVLRSRVVTTTSDDGRDVLEATDINGDGSDDQHVHRVIGDDGRVIVTESAFNEDGTLQSEVLHWRTDTGLSGSTKYDADGNGVYERKTIDSSVLNADGSTTRTIVEKAEDDTGYSRTVVDTSADGWTTTTHEDWDNDGDNDLTTVEKFELSRSGNETVSVTQTAADGSKLYFSKTETSADKQIVTVTTDADGNEKDDSVSTSTIANNGTWIQDNEFFDENGVRIATSSFTRTDDGLRTTARFDRDGDDTDELVIISETTLADNGSRTETTNYWDGSSTLLARTVSTVSGDGLSTSWNADIDGDGVNEFETDTTTVFEADGDVVQTATTTDGTGNILSGTVETTSGNGLTRTVATDLTGNGSSNVTSDLTTQADGAWEQSNKHFSNNGTLVHRVTSSQSADGWTRTVQVDQNGDAKVDRDLTVEIDQDRTVTSTYRDLNGTGSATAIITGSEAANGMSSNYQFDLDGDGETEIQRSSQTSFDDSGNRISTVTEIHGAVDSYAPKVSYSETSTTSADGLTQTIETDTDGDGSIDATALITRTLKSDGSQTVRHDSSYADGSTKSTMVRELSADGRHIDETLDYDGDGNNDVEFTKTVGADGRLTTVEKSFYAEGEIANTRTTTVSADELVQTIVTDDTSFSIDRSPIGNGSYETVYTSDDLSFTSSHRVDGSGIETWQLERTVDDTTSTFEFRLDAGSKERIYAEAERLYDTVFDRDLDSFEYELLAAHVSNGELDIQGLADELIQSDEFTARYPDVSDAGFIDQLYINTNGRGASLDEYDSALNAMKSGSATRAQLASNLSESSEHKVVGNGHMSSNNFDVHLQPAQAERFIDKAYIWSVVESLVDVLFDINLIDIALELTAKRTLDGDETLLDLAERLVNRTADLNPDEQANLSLLSEGDFVRLIFRNAFSREPSNAELAKWKGYLEAGDLSRGEFALMAARSPEHLTAGAKASQINRYLQLDDTQSAFVDLDTEALDGAFGDSRSNKLDASGHSRKVQIEGGEGNDSVWGGNNDDFLSGDAGADDVRGHGGNDVLFVDADDLESGFVDGGDGVDTLRIVGETPVTVSMQNHNAEVVFGGEGADSITGASSSYNLKISGGDGNDTLEGGVGQDFITGDEGDDSVLGGDGGDLIYGGTGHDQLDGQNSDDYLSGGSGNDSAWGGIGDDQILGGSGDDWLSGHDGDDWIQGGDGNDTIRSGLGDDQLNGGDGDDILIFWRDDDTLIGGNGDDTFRLETSAQYGGLHHFGWSVLYGGKGKDVLVLDEQDGANLRHVGGNQWQITDYDTSDGKMVIDLVDIEEVRLTDGSLVWSLDTEEDEETSDDYVRSNPDSSMGDSDFYTHQSYNDRQYIRGANTYYQSNELAGWSGNDTLSGNDQGTLIRGGQGADSIVGGNGADTVHGGAGADTMYGLGGDDTLYAGYGADLVVAGSGNDELYGDTGDDVLIGQEGNDTIYGFTGDDYAEGGDGDDSLLGEDGFDWLEGGDGADTLTGGAGGDTLYGDLGDDSLDGQMGLDLLNGGDGEDTLQGHEGYDTLHGDAGNDSLSGGDDDDFLFGGTGNDTLNGDLGRDYLEGGAGADALNGGAGILDTASYASSDSAVSVNLTTGAASGGHAQGDTITEIENLSGSSHHDILTGNTIDNVLDGGAGNDTLRGEDGHDYLVGGDGNDSIHGGSGNDRVWGGLGSDTVHLGDGDDQFFADDHSENPLGDTVYGDDGNDEIYGGSNADDLSGGTGDDIVSGGQGDDELSGHSGDDTLNGEGGSDTIRGGANRDLLLGANGDDTLLGGTGADELRGGNGNDEAAYWDASTGVLADLADASANTEEALGDTFVSIENLSGSAYGDTLRGDDSSNSLNGMAGDDWLYGRAGGDSLYGGAGDDTLEGGSSADLLVGGDGVDMASYKHAAAGVRVNLADLSQNSGEAANDTYVGIEGAQGSDFADTLIGDTSFNILSGQDGADSLRAWGGDDTVYGGGGNDTLFGDDGEDYLSGGDGDDSLEGGNKSDELHGGSGRDTLLGQSAGDILYGNDGDDVLEGGSSADVLDGGDGLDLASYESSDAAVDVNLTLGVGTGGDAEGDTLTSIERLLGSGFGDTLRGDASANILYGRDGQDTLDGEAGNDRLEGGNDNDRLYGREGDDTLRGGNGNDVLQGETGADLLEGGSGTDTFIYKTGYDQDLITDFQLGTDVLDLSEMGFGSQSELLSFATESGADVVFDFGNGDTLTVQNTTIAALQDDIILV